ncbi:MAG: hypothetical protein ACD_72C00262G0005, partial [uncultured bacterium]
MAILVSGSLVYDHIMNFPDSFKNHIMPEQLHILNVCFMVDKLERSWGGTAGNIAYNVQMLGGEPLLVSVLGKDSRDYVEYLQKCGIKTDYVLIDKNQNTASANITTDVDDNQITAFFGGPLGQAKNQRLADFVKEKYNLTIVCPTDKEVMIQHVKESKEMGIKVIFDPGQQTPAFSGTELKQMISAADFVIGNDYEMKLIQERTEWSEKEILENTKCLIMTLGEKGSVIKTSEGEVVEVGVCAPLSVDDPTGAGDAYRAGFFVG